jgi:GAF domain-containing protein
MGVLAWAGYPLRAAGGEVLGTFCVVDTATRDWTADDVDVIASLAGAVEGEIRLRIMLDEAAAAADQAHDAAELRDRLTTLAERLAAAETTSAVARAITDLGPAALGASVATLGIVDDERRELVLHGPLSERTDLAASYTTMSIDEDRPITAAVRLGRPIYLSTTAEMCEQFPKAGADAVTLGLSAGAALPLHQPDGEVLGAMSIGWASEMDFDGEARALLRTVTWMCAQSLRRARLGDVRRQLMEQLQNELLPAIPSIVGLDVAVRYLPATSGLGFGGDWYDIVELDDGRVTVVVGDIPGHGIEAAARMSQVRAAISALARLYTDDLATVCSEAERILSHLDDRYLATVVLITIDPGSGTITYLAAGHPAPLLAMPDGTVSALGGGRRPLLGCGQGPCEAATASIPHGGVLFAFTDGLVERRDQTLDEGISRMIETIRAAGSTPETLADRIVGELIGDRSVTDDVALVAIRRRPIDP